MAKKTVNKSSGMKSVVWGAGLAGLAATAYFFLGADGKKNQKHAKAWAIKMKGDVVEKLESAREVSEGVYQEIIDSVANEHKKGKKAGHEEISSLAQDLKKHWKVLSKGSQTVKRDVVRDVKKVIKAKNVKPATKSTKK